MEERVSCAVCLERYDNSYKTPLMLLCGHTFCRSCLVQMSKNGLGVLCPNDRQKDLRNVNSLPKNFALLDIIQELDISKTRSLRSIIALRKENLDKAVTRNEELKGLNSVLIEEENRSLRDLSTGFVRVREAVDKKEQELKTHIKQTHENLTKKIQSLEGNFKKYIENEESEIIKLEDLKAKLGEDHELDAANSKVVDPPINEFEETKEMIGKLPIKVLLAPSCIEDSIQKSARILDETLARVSSLSAIFIRDLRVQDGDRFVSGASFVKTWRLRNDGEEGWPESC